MTEGRVIAAIARAKGISPEGLTADTTLEELEIDSLDAIEILFELEEEFDLEIPDDAVKGMERVSEVVDAIREALASVSPGSGG